MCRLKRLDRLADLWTRGCTSKTQLSAALGVDVSQITKDIKNIQQQWARQSSVSMADKLNRRIQQLESVAYEARNGFDRSREDSQEMVSVRQPCGTCRGEGRAVRKDDQLETEVECPTCDGLGTVLVETVRRRGQAGDAKFLAVAFRCVVEAAKMEGHYTGRGDDPALSYAHRTEIVNIHNQINIADAGPNPFERAPAEKVLQAHAAFLAITESVRDNEGLPEIIDAESTVVKRESKTGTTDE